MLAPPNQRMSSTQTTKSYFSDGDSDRPFGEYHITVPGQHNRPRVPQIVGSAPTPPSGPNETKISAPSFDRQQSINTITSYDTDDSYNPYEEEEPQQIHVPRVEGHHPNRAARRAATKIQSLLRGKKGRDRAATMRNAQVNEAKFILADIESILKELEDCHSENDRLKQQLVQRKGRKKKRREKPKKKSATFYYFWNQIK